MPPPQRRTLLALSCAAALIAGAGGVANAAQIGTPAPDVLRGTPAADTQVGSGGNDDLAGGPGADTQSGGAGSDTLNGGTGNDKQSGGPGSDAIQGGPGADTISGGPGPDVLAGGPGPDTISCGSGQDTVYSDSSDTLQGCLGDTILAKPAYYQAASMPTRLQWNANDGYCGETSFIAAGMSFGQYTSQWTARSLGAPGVKQTSSASQLLPTWPPPGTWQTAATAMRLNAVGFDPTQYEESTPTYADVFLSWVKNQFLQGSRVIIGVFNNVGILGEPGPGQPEYDHVVPVMGIGSNSPLVANDDPGNATYYGQKYYDDDQLTIGDNGLYTPFAGSGSPPNFGAGNTLNNPQGSTLYTYGFTPMQKTRRAANDYPSSCDNDSCSPYLYSLYRNGQQNLGNYGVAISGVTDTTPGGPVTAPVSLAATPNNEGSQDQATMSTAPAAQPMSLTVTVTIPDQSRAWNVYLYTSFSNVPRGSFNTAATAEATKAGVAKRWVIPAGSGASWTRTLTTVNGTQVNTGGTYAFRAVPTTAP